MIGTGCELRPGDLIHWSLVYLISEWVIRLVMLSYVPPRRSAAAARSWLLLIFLLPWPGLLLYLLIGRIRLPKTRFEGQQRVSNRIRVVQEQMDLREAAHPVLPATLQPLVSLATRLGDFEPFGGNQIELITDYTSSLDRIVAEIDLAQRHVHLLFYIFADDAAGQLVADALARAVKRGVKCRVLMDAVGSKRGLARLAPRLGAGGIEVHSAMPVGFFRRNAARYDLRNHRKIAVIDGLIAYTGSQNVVDPEFVRGYPNEEMMVRVTGPVVAQLQAVFVSDFYFETGATLDSSEVFPKLEARGRTTAQVLPSGPGYHRENGQELMVALLYAARERIVLTTPYFVPDEVFLQAIRSASRRGVAVHLILSLHANQLLTQLAQRSFYDELLEDRVNVHLYKPRFLHAKHLTIDNELAVVGSTNIDIRSFALNAEINLVIYDPDVVSALRVVQEKYISNSDLLTIDLWRQRSLVVRTIHGIARLADSLL
jgi:cardiolipin synthase